MTDHTTTGSNGGAGTTATVQEHATEVVGSVKEQGAEVARSAVEHARTVVDSAGQQVQQQGREQASKLADSLAGVSSELRSMADSAQGGTMVGDVTRSLAESTDRVATVLRDEGPDGVLRRASDFGREHPIQFLALAAGAGFAVARIVRNSDARRFQQVARDAVSGDGGRDGEPSGSGGNAGGGTSPTDAGRPPNGGTLGGSTGSATPAEAAPVSGTGTPAVPPGGDVMTPGGVPTTPRACFVSEAVGP
jgi:hypothetical protein